MNRLQIIDGDLIIITFPMTWEVADIKVFNNVVVDWYKSLGHTKTRIHLCYSQISEVKISEVKFTVLSSVDLFEKEVLNG